MKFKTVLLISFLISLNLYGFEPMNPSRATKKPVMIMGRLMVELFVMQTMVPTLLLLVLNAMTIKRNINLKNTL